VIYSLIQKINNVEVLGINPTLAIIISIILIPYTWFGNIVGALISYVIRSKNESST
jgi:hypothetical protein